jgi:branched-subunit amino acid transport protein
MAFIWLALILPGAYMDGRRKAPGGEWKMTYSRAFLAIAVMAGVTYLIRMIPLVLFRKRIDNLYIRSFLAYVPYAVLSAMTFPDILYATGSTVSAAAGTVVALVLAFFNKSLLTVAISASAAVFIVQLLVK